MIVRVLSLVTTIGMIVAVVFRANYCARIARAELAKSAEAERAATAAPTAADSSQSQSPAAAPAQTPPAPVPPTSSDIWRAPAHIQARRQAAPPSVVDRVMAERYLDELAERNQDARTKDTAADRREDDR